MPTGRAVLASALAATALGPVVARAQSGRWYVRAHDRGGKAVPGPRRKQDQSAEPDPLAWPHPALAAGRGARHFRPADPAGRQRRLRFSAALWGHVLDALPRGAAGTVADVGAADHS